MSKIFILLLIVAAISAASTRRPPLEPIRDCGPNAVWKDCTSVCPDTCESIRSKKPVFCTKQCRIGCACIKGFVQRTKGSVECISPVECRI